MTDFFSELEEDIREERIFLLWRKYGNYLIGLAIAIVIGTAGYTLWKYLQHKSQIQAQISFSKAVNLMKQGNKDEALQAFQALIQQGGGYGKIAQLYEASLLPTPEGLYIKMSRKYAADPALGNLPIVLAASRDLNNPEILTSIESLSSPNNAWAPLSLELLAFLDLKKGDQVKAAQQYIKILKEPYTTSHEQFRASLMLSQLDVPSYLLEEEGPEGAKP